MHGLARLLRRLGAVARGAAGLLTGPSSCDTTTLPYTLIRQAGTSARPSTLPGVNEVIDSDQVTGRTGRPCPLQAPSSRALPGSGATDLSLRIGVDPLMTGGHMTVRGSPSGGEHHDGQYPTNEQSIESAARGPIEGAAQAGVCLDERGQ